MKQKNLMSDWNWAQRAERTGNFWTITSWMAQRHGNREKYLLI